MARTRVVLTVETELDGPLAPDALQDLIARFSALTGSTAVRVAEQREVGNEEGDGGSPPEEEPAANPSGWTEFREFEDLWELLSPGAKRVLVELAKKPSGYPA